MDVFKPQHSYCRSNADCTARDVIWSDGSQLDYDASLFNLYFYHHHYLCSLMSPDIGSRTSSTVYGDDCHSSREFMCSAPCDDQSKYLLQQGK